MTFLQCGPMVKQPCRRSWLVQTNITHTKITFTATWSAEEATFLHTRAYNDHHIKMDKPTDTSIPPNHQLPFKTVHDCHHLLQPSTVLLVPRGWVTALLGGVCGPEGECTCLVCCQPFNCHCRKKHHHRNTVILLGDHCHVSTVIGASSKKCCQKSTIAEKPAALGLLLL